MDIEKMRAEFEAWHKVCLEKAYGDDALYDSDFTQAAWMGWQASRAALVIELPLMTNNGFDGFYLAYEVKRSIEAAGLKVQS